MEDNNPTDIHLLQDEDIKKIRSTVKRVPYKGKRAKTGQKPNAPILIGITVAATALIVAGVFLIVKGLIPTDPLKGSWSYDEVTIYTFDGGGHGSLVLPLNTYEYTYKTENEVLLLDFADDAVEDKEYSYQLSEGVLTLTGSDGAVYIFKKIV